MCHTQSHIMSFRYGRLRNNTFQLYPVKHCLPWPTVTIFQAGQYFQYQSRCLHGQSGEAVLVDSCCQRNDAWTQPEVKQHNMTWVPNKSTPLHGCSSLDQIHLNMSQPCSWPIWFVTVSKSFVVAYHHRLHFQRLFICETTLVIHWMIWKTV